MHGIKGFKMASIFHMGVPLFYNAEAHCLCKVHHNSLKEQSEKRKWWILGRKMDWGKAPNRLLGKNNLIRKICIQILKYDWS